MHAHPDTLNCTVPDNEIQSCCDRPQAVLQIDCNQRFRSGEVVLIYAASVDDPTG